MIAKKWREKINLDKRQALANGMWLYLLQFFNSVIPLITLPYITRILGKEMFGTFTTAINIIGYLQVVTEYGFIMSATRKVVYANGDQHKLNKLFSCVIYSRVLLMIVSFVLSACYMHINYNDNLQRISFLLLVCGLFGYCVQMNWMFQGMQEMKYISIISIISRTLSLIAIFTLVKKQTDLPLYCIAYSITPIANGFVGLWLSQKKYKVKFIKVKIADIIKELKDGWYVFTTQVSTIIFGSIGVTFLGMFTSPAIVGEFAAIQKIPNVLLMIWAPIGQVLYPISSAKFKSKYEEGVAFALHYRKVFLIVFFTLTVALALCANQIVTIAFGRSYAEHFYWIYPLLAWVIVSINNNFLGIQILLGSNHDKEYSRCFQIGVFCTVCFNYVLIKLFNGNGASLAPLFSEIVLSLLLVAEIKKTRNQH